MITTEENGNFSFNNLKLYDSSKLAVLAKTIKGKRGKVLLDSRRQYSPATPDVEPLKIEVYKAENPSKYNTSSEFLNARMLDEVVIHGARETAKELVIWRRRCHRHRRLSSRYELKQYPDLSLQTMVPGLRVVNGTIIAGTTNSLMVCREPRRC